MRGQQHTDRAIRAPNWIQCAGGIQHATEGFGFFPKPLIEDLCGLPRIVAEELWVLLELLDLRACLAITGRKWAPAARHTHGVSERLVAQAEVLLPVHLPDARACLAIWAPAVRRAALYTSEHKCSDAVPA